MTALPEFVVQKRLNFAKFIRENTINNLPVVEKHIEKMLALDPVLFLQFIKYNANGKTDDEITKALLEEVGLQESDFNPEAKPKFLQYINMFVELTS